MGISVSTSVWILQFSINLFSQVDFQQAVKTHHFTDEILKASGFNKVKFVDNLSYHERNEFLCNIIIDTTIFLHYYYVFLLILTLNEI